jgi:hypothetical protein
MAKEKIYIQDYEIKGSVLEITSGSGKKYELTQKSCTCKGFGFRRTCGHIQEAEEKGLLKKLIEKQGKKIHLSKSDNRIRARKDALKKFLEKNDVPFDEVTIDNLEKYVTQETTPEKLLHMARTDKKVEVLKQYGV